MRTFTGHKWAQCPIKTPVTINATVPESFTSTVTFVGVFTLSEEVIGDMDFVFTASRCSLDMKTCEKFNSINVKGMCEKFKDRHAFYSGVLEAIHPRIECPVQPNNYTVAPSSMDLSFTKFLSVEGYILIANYKLVTTDKKSKTKRIIVCINQEVKILNSRMG